MRTALIAFFALASNLDMAHSSTTPNLCMCNPDPRDPYCVNGVTHANLCVAKCQTKLSEYDLSLYRGECKAPSSDSGYKSGTTKTQTQTLTSTAAVNPTSVPVTTTTKQVTTPMPDNGGYQATTPTQVTPTPAPYGTAKPESKPSYGAVKPANVKPGYGGETKSENKPSYGGETKPEQEDCGEQYEETPVCFNGQTYPSEGQALAKGADRSQIIKGACKNVEEPAIKNALYCGSSVKEDGTCSGTTSFEGGISSSGASVAWNSLVALIFVFHV